MIRSKPIVVLVAVVALLLVISGVGYAAHLVPTATVTGAMDNATVTNSVTVDNDVVTGVTVTDSSAVAGTSTHTLTQAAGVGGGVMYSLDADSRAAGVGVVTSAVDVSGALGSGGTLSLQAATVTNTVSLRGVGSEDHWTTTQTANTANTLSLCSNGGALDAITYTMAGTAAQTSTVDLNVCP